MSGVRGAGATPVEVRLMRRVTVQDNGCWLYGGFIDPRGYGRIGNRGVRSVLAHRSSYEAFVGPIPDGLELDHVCHSNDPTCTAGDACLHRRCVNPDHLEPVMRVVNRRRARNFDVTRCPAGHEYTEANTYRTTLGVKACRACAAARSRVNNARAKVSA